MVVTPADVADKQFRNSFRGYNEQEVTRKFAGKGLAGFIQKPYMLSTLKEAVRLL